MSKLSSIHPKTVLARGGTTTAHEVGQKSSSSTWLMVCRTQGLSTTWSLVFGEVYSLRWFEGVSAPRSGWRCYSEPRAVSGCRAPFSSVLTRPVETSSESRGSRHHVALNSIDDPRRFRNLFKTGDRRNIYIYIAACMYV